MTTTTPQRLWEPGLAYTDQGGWFAGERSTGHHDLMRFDEAQAALFAAALFTAETTGADWTSQLLLPMRDLDSGGLYLQSTDEPGNADRLGPDDEGFYLVGDPVFEWDAVRARPAGHPAQR